MVRFEFENISDAVFHHAARQPDAPALIAGHETISYRTLATLVGQATVYLRAQGLKAGDRIAIAMTNSIARAVFTLGCMRMGLVDIGLPSETTAPILASVVSRFAATATAVETGGPEAPARVRVVIGLDWRAQLANFAGDVRFAGSPEALRTIVLSSGSTGIPKGHVATQQQRIIRAANYVNFSGYYRVENPAVLLLAAPPNTSFLLQFMISQFLLGGACVLLPDYKYLIDLVRQVQAYDDCIFPVPPGMVRLMLKYAPATGVLFPTMRALVVSGQPMLPQDKLSFLQHLSPNLYDSYGCTGFGLVACCDPAIIRQQTNTVGRPVAGPGAVVEIVDDHGAVLAPGKTGQLRLRGPAVGVGFFHPEDNARGTERFVDGAYYPGDVGFISPDGYLVLEGRLADAIQIGNAVIYPSEIEEVIIKHSHVADVAVVGRPGADGVEEIVAFVVGKPGFKHKDIDTYCKGALAFAKRPKYIFYLDQMPKTPNGKVDKQALRAAPLNPIGPA
ncbi:MAG: hypothetical protein B7Z75_13595 [Acidocella sp. 20-57-95]|nr:MAG: hypothetical protein B7Z75_13595 [Acidocella sp. 20-57-95]OYV62258.1 MAG: hypothetical protein B7Z71_01840 [Acidocella sp. 21-58-7]HQT63087.1 class I adenylate-forming enzyme family protein [Acidocella sp.]